jgi:hypothetical protein
VRRSLVGSTPTLFRHRLDEQMNPPFLDELREAAETAKHAETTFRREAANRIAALERERAFAFRRLNLMQAAVEAMASAESEELAVAGALAALRSRLGWTTDSEGREEVLTHFGPVALAIYQALDSGERECVADMHAALATFEDWYAGSRGSSFWTLFEHPTPDTSPVDF